MTQPTGSPPEQWQERKDFASRQIIERVDQAREAMTEAVEDKLDERLKSHVTWPGIWGSAIGLLGLVATMVFTLMGPQKDALAAERRERLDVQKDMATEFRELRKALESQSKETGAAIQAIKDVIVEGKARREAQQDLRRTQGAINGR